MAAQYRRWSLPRAANDSSFPLFLVTAVMCFLITYGGYAWGMARAISGHFHLTMPGLLLPTMLAIVYSAAGPFLGAGLFVGALLGCHWFHVVMQEFLGKRRFKWLRQPEQAQLWERLSLGASALGYILGPVGGAIFCILWTAFFVGLIFTLLAYSLLVGLGQLGMRLLLFTVKLAWWVQSSGVHAVIDTAAAGAKQHAADAQEALLENFQDVKDGFDRTNFQQVNLLGFDPYDITCLGSGLCAIRRPRTVAGEPLVKRQDQNTLS